MDIREPSARYAEIGAELIGDEDALAHLAASSARIAYLSSSHAKRHSGKAVFGECEKVPEKYKWGLPFDFVVTVFEPNVEGFGEAQMRTLIFHELLHAGVSHDKDGNERYSIVPHDYGEFREVYERCGLDWYLPSK